jgi:two-component system, OmpR family, phosphate regulon sensor histidine kinase PhoR
MKAIAKRHQAEHARERHVVTAQAPADHGQGLALVASADAEVLALAQQSLCGGGFGVLAATGPEEALQAARTGPDVVVLCDSIPGLPGLLRRLKEDEASARLPVILLVMGDDDTDEALLTVSDYLVRPFRPHELLRRVRTVLGRARLQQSRRQAAEQLREQTRAVSAAIRRTNTPEVMAEQLVSGLAAAFNADRVWLATFQDSRVPLLANGWSRGLPETTVPLGESGVQAESLAALLWERSMVLSVDDHAADQPNPSESGVPGRGRLNAWALARGARASAVAAIGQGDQPFGIVWMSTAEPRRWSNTELALLQHVASNFAYGLVQGHLITAQQQVVQRLQELDRAKSEFVATVNHELRTPLTSIIGYLDMLEEGGGGPLPDGAARMLRVVDRNAHRLRGLIEDLLTLSRTDAGDVHLTIAPVPLAPVLKAVVAALEPIAEARNVAVRLADIPATAVVDGDEAQLERVFTNITSNAVKFTPAGGKVELSAVLSDAGDNDGGGSVTVNVADTGIGIPEQDIPRLFSRFFRASNATAAAIPGTGLGLSIVRDVLEQHGGRLAITSAVGQGTTMAVTLPLRTGS